jgi:probable HAF family extracellular repeat protein
MVTNFPRSILPFVCTLGAVVAMPFGGAVSTVFAAASLTPLGDLPGGDFASDARGVSGDGSVVVGFSSSENSQNSPLGYEAFRWTASGGMVGLSGPSGTPVESAAAGVSADGSVVVGLSSSENAPNNDALREALRWTAGSGMVGLGDLPGGNFHSDARGVSADGSVVVGYSHSTLGNQAFRWTSDGGMVGLGGGIASGVSSDGSVIVGQRDSASGLEAFRWTSSGGMVGLGVLPGDDYSGANGVSADGSVIVGYGGTALGYDEAFRWTSGGGMERLWDVLVANGVNPAAAGWTNLALATGVSADGNTIVGTGFRNGNTEAFVAVLDTVPEPSSLVLLTFALPAILRRRS